MRSLPDMAMSQFTTLPTSFEDDLKLCGEAPLKAIELCEAKLDRDRGKALRQLEALQKAGVGLVSFQPRVHSLYPDSMAAEPQSPEDRVKAMCAGMDLIAEVFQPNGIPSVVIGGVPPDGNVRGAYDKAKELFPRLCDHAAKRGFTVAYETIHPILMNHDTFTWKLEDAEELVGSIGRAELGFVIDVWHVFWEAGLSERLRRMAPRVRVVHLSDHPRQRPRNYLDRLVMGTGQADFPAIFRALEDGGYSGPYCLELLSDKKLPDSLWNWPTVKLVQENRRAFAELWKQAEGL